MKRYFFTLAGACLLGMSLPAFAYDITCAMTAGNIVTNCGFEDGTYTSTIGSYSNPYVPAGWTPNKAFDMSPGSNFVTPFPTNSGFGALVIGNEEEASAPMLSQTLTDVAGTNYNGQIWVAFLSQEDGYSRDSFQVLINNTPVLTLGSGVSSDFSLETFSFLGTGSDTLTLAGITDGGNWVADDVSVGAGAPPVPEPAEMLPMAGISAVMAGFFYFARRRRQTC